MFRVLGKLLVGLLAVVGTLVVLIAGGLTLIVPRLLPATAPVPDAVILTLDLDQDLREGMASGWLPGIDGAGPRLPALLEALENAAADDRVRALVARVRSPAMGMAQSQEIRDAIHAFRAGGKPAWVFADTMPAGGSGTKALYLASAFSSIWVQPSGEVGLTGLAMEIPFLGDALGEWGLSVDGLSREEYKSALSSFSEADIPPPQEENLRRLLTSWFDQIQAGVSAARGIPLETLRPIIDHGPLPPGQALDAGLIDQTGYTDDFQRAIETEVGDHPRLSVTEYASRLNGEKPEDARRIALIHGLGPVLPGGGEETPDFGVSDQLRARDLADAVRQAVDDERVAAIVLRLDSPGGDYVASDTARRAVAEARERGTPIIVSMGNVVASGGYFIALEADHILASPGTVTGSIGVAAGKPVASALWANLGVSWARLSEGRNADMWSINAPFSPSARHALNQRLDAIYADFTSRVGRARELSGSALDRATRGRVFTGADAREVGLVDQIGGLGAALRLAREMAALPAEQPVVVAPYPAPLNPVSRLLKTLQTDGLPGLASGLSGMNAAELHALARLALALDPVLSAVDLVREQGRASMSMRYRGPIAPNGGDR